MSEPRLSRLHPISIIYFVVKSLKESYSYSWTVPIILLFIRKSFDKDLNIVWFFVVAILILAAVLLTVGILRWKSFMYQVNSDSIYIKSGIFVKKERWITPERLQSIDSTIRTYDRIFKTITLTLEVAGGEDSSVVLSCITQEEAERIRSVLVSNHAQTESIETTSEVKGEQFTQNAVHDQAEESFIQIHTRDLIIHSMLSPKFGVIFFLLLGLGFKLWRRIEEKAEIDVVSLMPQWIISNWIVLSIGLLLVLSGILSFLLTLIGDYQFKLRMQGDEMYIERGLFEKKKTSIPQKRIQSVLIIQKPLQRLFGYVCVRVIFVRSSGKKDSDKTVVLHPILRIAEVPAFLETYTSYHVGSELKQLNRKSLRYYLLMPLIISLVICIPLFIFVPKPYGWFAPLIPIWTVIVRILEYKLTGWRVEENQLTIQNGVLTRRVALIHKDRVQWSRLTQTIFQQKREIASFKVAIASASDNLKLSLSYIPMQDAEQAMEWTQRKRK